MEGSKPQQNVYDRLYDKRSYTGVYRKRFEGDGRINADTQVSLMRAHHPKTAGAPNSDQTIHALSSLMRPNLNKEPAKTKTSEVGVDPLLPPPPTTTVIRAPVAATTIAPPPVPTGTAAPDPGDPHSILKFVFQYYCRFGRTGAKGAAEKTLDNTNFAKFSRQCPGLLSEKFTKTSVDLIFMKAKKKGMRRLTYPRFLDALGMIATQKFPDLELEQSVPLLLEEHIAQLPCIQDLQKTEEASQAQDEKVNQVAEQMKAKPSKRASTTLDVMNAVSMTQLKMQDTP